MINNIGSPYAIVNGLKIYGFKSQGELLEFTKSNNCVLISAGAESIMRKDEKFNMIASCNLAYPDGVGAVYALSKKGIKTVKIAGAELWLEIIKQRMGEPVYLLGSSQKVIDRTVQKLRSDFKEINIVGYRNGYFKDNEISEIKQEVMGSGAKIILITLGQPRQEYLAYEMLKDYPALYMGLGGSFDVYCGIKKRAPNIFINCHLEWLYRLLQEPLRFRRQLVLLQFVMKFLLKRL